MPGLWRGLEEEDDKDDTGLNQLYIHVHAKIRGTRTWVTRCASCKQHMMGVASRWPSNELCMVHLVQYGPCASTNPTSSVYG